MNVDMPVGSSSRAGHNGMDSGQTCLREHELRKGLRTLYLVLTVLGASGLIAASGFALWSWYFAYRHFGPALVTRWSLPAFGIGFVSTILAFIGLGFILRDLNMHVGVYPSGITFLRGRQRRVIPWDRIQQIQTTSVRYGFPGLSWGKHTTLMLSLTDGNKIRISDAVTDLPDLIKTVKNNVYPRLLNLCRQQLNEGRAVDFGPISLTPKGVQKKPVLLQWDQIQELDIERGVLCIDGNDKGLDAQIRVPTHRIPNIDLCVSCIRQLISNTDTAPYPEAKK
jgi:hypothetical protein